MQYNFYTPSDLLKRVMNQTMDTDEYIDDLNDIIKKLGRKQGQLSLTSKKDTESGSKTIGSVVRRYNQPRRNAFKIKQNQC